MLKAAQYYPLFVTEDNIAQASHNLDNQPVTRAFNAVHILAMTGDQLDHPFPARLLYGIGMFGWLNNGIDARPHQQGAPLVGNRSKRNCIYEHNLILSASPATYYCMLYNKGNSSSATFSLDRQYNKEWSGCIAARAGAKSRCPALIEPATPCIQRA